jgi:predicted CopG family antitoxin
VNNVNNIQYKRIVVTESNYKKLKGLGSAGDSFNDVITDILEKIYSLQQSTTGVGSPNEIVVNPEHSFKEKNCQ